MNTQYQVIARGTVDTPTLSGDGQVLAWRRMEPGISEIERQVRGEEPELLTDDRYADKAPRLNYDGSVCVWERYDKEGTKSWDIYRKGPGDEEPVAIGATPGPDWDVDVSDDGNRVVWGAWSPNYRDRRAMVWDHEEGMQALTEPPTLSGLPQIADDGGRIFYLQLAPASSTNSIWMVEPDGYQKPVLFETDENSKNNRRAFVTSESGDWLAWVEKEGAAPASLYRWNLTDGRKDKIAEAALITNIDISDDAETVVWTEGGLPGSPAQIKVYHNGQVTQLTDDSEGHNSTPTLSDDGKTIVWLWRNPKYLHPNEVRLLDLES